MSLKNNPISLFILSLQHFSEVILAPCEKWYDIAYGFSIDHRRFSWDTVTYQHYCDFAENMQKEIQTSIPPTILNQLFDLIIDTHARKIVKINKLKCNLNVPNISWVINTLITNNLHRLNLNCLRHIGNVKDEELLELEFILLNKIPNMTKLTEISLHTSGTENTMPICNDKIMKQIGISCQNLRTLDIQYNHTVTDVGLECLLPHNNQIGCPALSKITLFECSVTIEGVANLITGMPKLKFLGFRETGLCLMLLNNRSIGTPQKLEIVHVNNLGIIGRTCKDIYQLRFNSSMYNAISKHCPKLTGLKVRVCDSEVRYLEQLNNVFILELVYNIGRPSSPGIMTAQYLSNCGTRLISLSIVCDNFSTQYLKLIGANCTNLKRLWIRCNRFLCEEVISKSDKQKCKLSNLQVFLFRIGSKEDDICTVPLSVIDYVLHQSNDLKEIILAMRNSIFTDSYIEELFNSINTSELKRIIFSVPCNNPSFSINFSMISVETMIYKCPQLELLGNLLGWDISEEEKEEKINQLKLVNSSLKLVSKEAYS